MKFHEGDMKFRKGDRVEVIKNIIFDPRVVPGDQATYLGQSLWQFDFGTQICSSEAYQGIQLRKIGGVKKIKKITDLDRIVDEEVRKLRGEE